jgi:localization factor PodJL
MRPRSFPSVSNAGASMKSGAQLKLRGVRPEAIETAREAARRAGMSLAQWIDTAILETAGDVGIRPAQRAEAAGPPSPAADQPHGNLDPTARDLETRLAAMARNLVPRSEATPRRLADAIARLDRRLDQVIANKQAVDTLDREFARPPFPPAGQSFGLDQAIAEISARQRAIDGEADGAAAMPQSIESAAAHAPSPAPGTSGLEQLMRTIAGQLETLRRPCGAEDAMVALRHELGEINRTLTEAMPRHTLDAMQSELHALAERIDLGHPRGADAAALSGIEHGLNEVRDALNALAPAESRAGFDDEVKALARKVDLIAATGPDAETVEHLETAITELRNISARVASGEALAALASDVRTIGAKLDRVASPQAPDHDGMDHLVRRIDVLAAALEQRPGAGAPSDTAHVESLIKGLADKLEMVETIAGGHGFEQLEAQLTRLTGKLDATDARLGNLGAIERAVADLMGQLHDARASAIDAAERAARTAAREMMGASAGAGPEVDALKHEFADFRSTQADIDRRTQDMLETLHGTLERLVDRLTAIETDIHVRATPGPNGSAASPATPAPLPGAVLSPNRSMPLLAGKPAIERRAINAGLPADHPLEPGTGAPRARAPATPAERIAASEAVLPTTKPAAAEPASKANFIAAARRAAQAAAADASSDGARTPDDRAGRSLLGMLAATIDKHRRALMIGVGVLLLVLGTLHLVANMLGSGEPARPVPGETTSVPRESTPALALAVQPNGLGAAIDPAAPRPAEAPPAPARQSDTTPTPINAPLDSKVPNVPAFPTLPGFANVKPAAEVTGSTGRVPATVAVAPAAPAAPHPAAADKLPPSTVGPGLRSAALAGNPAAEFELAIRYAEGRGVPANAEEAVRWFERAANHGVAPAQYRLGSIYEKGQGVKKDLEAARRLYTSAAGKGNGKAMHNLAVLYAEGLNGDPDYRNASQWFRKAADHGIADSQYNLGILYARGIGVEQNLAESYKWFALAAQQGDQDAGKKRDDVAARLDAQSLVAARLAVQTWTADPQPDEAVDVKPPAGGWEKPAAASHPAKVKPAVGPPRKLTPT